MALVSRFSIRSSLMGDEDDIVSIFLALFTGGTKTVEPPLPHSTSSIDFSKAVLGGVIGNGSSAIVHTSKLGDEEFVVKVLKPERKTAKSEFDKEIEALQILKDVPFVVRIRGTDDTISRRLFMEYCPNGELYAVIQKTGGMVEIVSRLFVRQLFDAVAGCHRKGVAHRDIKPENILFARDWSLRLADFGFATIGNELRSTQFCGSEGYAAPEIMAQLPYDPAIADVWSAGVTAFCIMVGTQPFEKTSRSCWLFCRSLEGDWESFWGQHARFTPAAARLSPDARRFLQRALNPYPKKRATSADMVADLWLRGETHAEIEVFMTEALNPPTPQNSPSAL